MKRAKHVVRVQPGHRIELVDPSLEEGSDVEIEVTTPSRHPNKSTLLSPVMFLDALPEGPRAFPSWSDYEYHLRRERNAWDQ